LQNWPKVQPTITKAAQKNYAAEEISGRISSGLPKNYRKVAKLL
jgi:hypothetical protein